MLPLVCLVVLLAAYLGAQVIHRAVVALEIDVWATLVYLGLAELRE